MDNKGNRQHPKQNPEIILISNEFKSNFYINLGRYFLKDFGKIELHAIENNSSIAVICSENLVRNNLAVITSTQISTVE
jgi:hypothetical protein